MGQSVLIVDDELDIQSSLSFALKDEGMDVLTASSPAEAKQLIAQNDIQLGLFDVWFPDGDGLELLQWTREHHPNLVCIMMSGHANIELALKSIRLGAYDFLEKPLELEKVLVGIRNALEAMLLRLENKRLQSELGSKAELIGSSESVQKLREQISKAAQSNSAVLITGENGVGKELVARALHKQSSRASKPFVAVNCASIPETLFESEIFGHEKGSFTGAHVRKEGRIELAADGVLFFDEIAELSTQTQSKLLRVLEEKQYERVGGTRKLKCEARILAATNRDIQREIKEGRFREDLFFRLNVLSIQVPALNKRQADIMSLAEYFALHVSASLGRRAPNFSAAISSWLLNYEWPGNVRELRNLVERMIIMGSGQAILDLGDLPEELQNISHERSISLLQLKDVPNVPLRELRARFEKTILEQRLDAFGGNVTKAAESLGLERAHLHRKLKQYGVQRGESSQ